MLKIVSYLRFNYLLGAMAFSLFWPGLVYAQQQTVSGLVKDKSNETLPNAHVKIVDENGTILNYCITNKDGEYSIRFVADKTGIPLWLEATYIGCKTQKVVLVENMRVHDFILETETFILPEIEVKSRPQIHGLGDTIRYDVASFTQKEDRNIGDVLRRMPGLEIANDGRIYFNGKEIENLYIHGDNLMDGRYAELPKMIRKEMIESVDVIRNFQPVKVLRNKVFSDKTAINLILKDENRIKVTYKTMAAGGLPDLYDFALTPILLNKNLKFINSIMANNSGIDYSNILSQLGASNLLGNIAEKPDALHLSLATAAMPDLPKQTWFNNKSALANFNNLVNFKNGLQFRVNFQAFRDNNSLEYINNSAYYVKNDTIKYFENQQLFNKPVKINSSADFMINKEHYYFNNNTKFNIARTSDHSIMNLNSAPFAESLNQNINELANDLTWIPALKGRNIITFRWAANYSNNEQNLLISNGLYYNIAGHKEYYDTILQRVHIPSFYSNAFFSYSLPGKRIVQEYKIGYASQIQQLNSSLFFKQSDSAEPDTVDSGNALNWNKDNLYLSGEYRYNQGRLKSLVQLPIAFQSIKYNQQQYDLNAKKRKFIFYPTLDIKYEISQKQNVRLNYNYSNPIGSMADIYRGAILMNYRLLHANDAELQENGIHSISINYGLENPVSMFFLNGGLQYFKINSNSILSNEISNNILKTILLPYNNSQENIQFNIGISKYLYFAKSSIALKTAINQNTYGQLVNNELLSFQNKGLLLQAGINKKVFRTVSLNYNPSCSWNYNKLNDNVAGDSQLNYRFYGFEQNLSLGTSLPKRMFVELNANQSYTKVSGNNAVKYVFMDCKARYTTEKSGIDFSFEVVNLFNVKQHTIFSNTFNQLSMSRYDLRGRMAILRVEYLF